MEYPGLIATHLGLKGPPPCSLCHTGGKMDATTATTPFALTARGAPYNLVPQNPARLTQVLDEMERDKTDSDKDTVPDIAELRAGSDPNSAGGVPQLTHGCAATLAPTGPAPSSGAALGLAMVAAVAWIRRRRGASQRSRKVVSVAALAGSVALFVGCYDTSFVSPDVCTSGLEWTGGDKGSPNMHPGTACISCHATNGGPQFKFAGTAYATPSADDCVGRNDATIVITGANGKSIKIQANESGNFYSDLDVTMPYRAMLVVGGVKTIMAAEQTSGDCNSCHTTTGANGAPGRIGAKL